MGRADARPLRTRPRPDDEGPARRRLHRARRRRDLFPVRRPRTLRGSTSTTRPSPPLRSRKPGVAVVPLSAFAEQDPPRHLVRLCFGKKDETIEAGVAAMARARELLA